MRRVHGSGSRVSRIRGGAPFWGSLLRSPNFGKTSTYITPPSGPSITIFSYDYNDYNMSFYISIVLHHGYYSVTIKS